MNAAGREGINSGGICTKGMALCNHRRGDGGGKNEHGEKVKKKKKKQGKNGGGGLYIRDARSEC